jgi:hypothetical protein
MVCFIDYVNIKFMELSTSNVAHVRNTKIKVQSHQDGGLYGFGIIYDDMIYEVLTDGDSALVASNCHDSNSWSGVSNNSTSC